MRLNAAQSDSDQLMEDFKAAENRYPDDYRFTYERAKLYIAGTTSHPQPFQLLYAAGPGRPSPAENRTSCWPNSNATGALN